MTERRATSKPLSNASSLTCAAVFFVRLWTIPERL